VSGCATPATRSPPLSSPNLLTTTLGAPPPTFGLIEASAAGCPAPPGWPAAPWPTTLPPPRPRGRGSDRVCGDGPACRRGRPPAPGRAARSVFKATGGGTELGQPSRQRHRRAALDVASSQLAFGYLVSGCCSPWSGCMRWVLVVAAWVTGSGGVLVAADLAGLIVARAGAAAP
jgi:hypothetical protein